MGIQGDVNELLWNAVQASYGAGNYRVAILDSIQFLTETIRGKSGLATDGAALVGEAFGGQTPIIRMNSLRTASERDEQKGILFLLQGLYIAIRNPRSHGVRPDTTVDADALIVFADFLLRAIEKAKSPYDTGDLFRRIFDPHFARSEKYANLLANSVPPAKRLDLLIQLFERRDSDNVENLILVSKALVALLGADETAAFWERTSEMLMECNEDEEFRTGIQLVGSDWKLCSEMARIRTEHRLIQSIKAGKYNPASRKCEAGSLGTWARGLGRDFLLKDDLISALADKLGPGKGLSERDYVYQYFMDDLQELVAQPKGFLLHYLKTHLKSKDDSTISALWFVSNPELRPGWSGALKALFDEASPPLSDDDIPF